MKKIDMKKKIVAFFCLAVLTVFGTLGINAFVKQAKQREFKQQLISEAKKYIEENNVAIDDEYDIPASVFVEDSNNSKYNGWSVNVKNTGVLPYTYSASKKEATKVAAYGGANTNLFIKDINYSSEELTNGNIHVTITSLYEITGWEDATDLQNTEWELSSSKTELTRLYDTNISGGIIVKFKYNDDEDEIFLPINIENIDKTLVVTGKINGVTRDLVNNETITINTPIELVFSDENFDKAILDNEIISSPKTVSQEGTHILEVSDKAGNVVKATIIIDQTPPEIYLNGDEEVYLEFNDTTFVDPVSAKDNGVYITDRIVKTIDGNVIDAIDTTIAGTFTVVYNVQDVAGNSATPKSRVFHILSEDETLNYFKQQLQDTIADATPYVNDTNYTQESRDAIDTAINQNIDLTQVEEIKTKIKNINDAVDAIVTLPKVIDVTISTTNENENYVKIDDDVIIIFTTNMELDTTKTQVSFSGGPKADSLTKIGENEYKAILNLNETTKNSLNLSDGKFRYAIIPVSTLSNEKGPMKNELLPFIFDIHNPVITIDPSEVEVEVIIGTEYNLMSGVTATDNGVYINTDKITMTMDGQPIESIDTSVLTTYEIVYDVKDDAGNPALERKTKTIKVIEDPELVQARLDLEAKVEEANRYLNNTNYTEESINALTIAVNGEVDLTNIKSIQSKIEAINSAMDALALKIKITNLSFVGIDKDNNSEKQYIREGDTITATFTSNVELKERSLTYTSKEYPSTVELISSSGNKYNYQATYTLGNIVDGSITYTLTAKSDKGAEYSKVKKSTNLKIDGTNPTISITVDNEEVTEVELDIKDKYSEKVVENIFDSGKTATPKDQLIINRTTTCGGEVPNIEMDTEKTCTVTYTATDLAGNVTTKEINVKVIDEDLNKLRDDLSELKEKVTEVKDNEAKYTEDSFNRFENLLEEANLIPEDKANIKDKINKIEEALDTLALKIKITNLKFNVQDSTKKYVKQGDIIIATFTSNVELKERSLTYTSKEYPSIVELISSSENEYNYRSTYTLGKSGDGSMKYTLTANTEKGATYTESKGTGLKIDETGPKIVITVDNEEVTDVELDIKDKYSEKVVENIFDSGKTATPKDQLIINRTTTCGGEVPNIEMDIEKTCTVTYTATDLAGNVTTKEINVKVIDEDLNKLRDDLSKLKEKVTEVKDNEAKYTEDSFNRFENLLEEANQIPEDKANIQDKINKIEEALDTLALKIKITNLKFNVQDSTKKYVKQGDIIIATFTSNVELKERSLTYTSKEYPSIVELISSSENEYNYRSTYTLGKSGDGSMKYTLTANTEKGATYTESKGTGLKIDGTCPKIVITVDNEEVTDVELDIKDKYSEKVVENIFDEGKTATPEGQLIINRTTTCGGEVPNIEMDIEKTCTVTYTATDLAGNVTTKEINVKVIDEDLNKLREDLSKLKEKVQKVQDEREEYTNESLESFDALLAEAELIPEDKANIKDKINKIEEALDALVLKIKITNLSFVGTDKDNNVKKFITVGDTITATFTSNVKLDLDSEKTKLKYTKSKEFYADIKLESEGEEYTYVATYTLGETKLEAQLSYTLSLESLKGAEYTVSGGTLVVADTIAPTIVLDTTNVYEMSLGADIPEFKATITDTNLDSENITNNIKVNVVGTYTVTFTAIDKAGNKTEINKDFAVKDTIPPVIELIGSNPQIIEVHNSYTELGAKVTDNYDTGLTATIDAKDVKVDVVGTYVVKYNITDASGNEAAEVIRTVKVVDTTPPVIELVGSNPQIIEVHNPYTELGAKVTDNYDTGLIATIDATDVKVDVVGTYVVKYNITDANGNEAAEVVRTVKVVDTIPPVIELVGLNPQIIEVHNPYTELGATVTDNYDTGLTVTIDATDVKVDVVGTYVVKYNVTDTNGNKATEVVRTVKVVDTEKPVIELIGSNPQVIEVHNPYTELGAKITDNYDTGLTATIDATDVKVDVVGTYVVKYNVTDTNGNEADEVTRTVKVVDTTAPRITLNGSNPQTIKLHSEYKELGATIIENYDENLEATIDASDVNIHEVGTYVVKYNVTDTNGNEADEVIRTVKVVPSETSDIVRANNNCSDTGICYNKNGENNYVWYSGYLWRIVSVNDDNTMKLITEDSISAFSYDDDSNKFKDSIVKDWLINEFYPTLNQRATFVVSADYCNQPKAKNATRTTCQQGSIVNSKVGLITLDEYNILGADKSFLNTGDFFYTMTKYSDQYIVAVDFNGEVAAYGVATNTAAVRPVITISNEIQIGSGMGTKEKPYRLVGDNSANDGDALNTRHAGEYVVFAGQKWRIIRTSNEITRLVLDDLYRNGTTPVKVNFGEVGNFSLTDGIGKYLNETLYNQMFTKAETDVMLEMSLYNTEYKNGTNPRHTSLLANNKLVKAYVGLNSVGGILSGNSSSARLNGVTSWLMNYNNSNNLVWYTSSGGSIAYENDSNMRGFKPVIELNNTVKITSVNGVTGDGTSYNPYILSY